MPHTLLLADDSVTIQRVIELTFADEDVRVVAVSDGTEAIALLDRTPPDIVLADVGMPGQNGYAVARHIRDTPSLSHIPVVLLTGAFEPIDQAKVAEVGCDGVLAKPFEPQLVIARVKELLARSKEPAGPIGQSAVADEIMRAPIAAVESSARREDIDSYFDRLDEAFTHLPGAASSTIPDSPLEPEPSVEAEPSVIDRIESAARYQDTDTQEVEQWGGSRLLTRTADAPSPEESQPSAHQPASAVFPSLAEAFAALLAAEQSSPAPVGPAAWPVTATSSAPAPAPAAPAVPDDLVEQVTRRVLEQLTDRAVREMTAEIVSGVAERLVKEEIQRLKDSIAE